MTLLAPTSEKISAIMVGVYDRDLSCVNCFISSSSLKRYAKCIWYS